MASNKTVSVNTISATSVQREVGTVIRRVAKNKEHLVIEYDGIPVAVIIPMADYERLMSAGEQQLIRQLLDFAAARVESNGLYCIDAYFPLQCEVTFPVD